MKGKKNIRLGFVGLRNNGCHHVRLALELPNVTIKALADTDAERVEKAAEIVKDGGVDRYDSAEALLAAPDVDAVILSLPNHLHAQMAIEAMRQGKDVMVEKPLARFPDEARKMIKVRDETGRKLMVGMNQRFVPTRVTARKLIADGKIGRVQQGWTHWLRDRTRLWGPGRGNWCLDWEKSGGGPMIDLGIHKLDMLLYVAGVKSPVKDISGFKTFGIGSKEAAEQGCAYEVEDYAFGLVRFENDFSMRVEASYFLNIPGESQDATIIGTEGAIRITGREATMTTWPEGEPETTEVQPDENTATSCVEHFCRVLHGQEELIPTAEEGLRGLEIVAGIYNSE